jgi:coproporphyrinogen III oxidase
MSLTPPPEVILFLTALRDQIVAAFESLEPSARFDQKPWDHHTGGGGMISVLRGEVFEKAAVNWSAVSGDHFPMQDGAGPFFATGVSLITHMANPHAPTVHMNLRYIATAERSWLAGGYDLTPMGLPYDEDKEHFHTIAADSLAEYPGLYQQFAENAKEYFFIPHRQKERGIGGLFFDHYNSGNFQADLAMWQAVGRHFLDAIMPIYQRRVKLPFSAEERRIQLQQRAHYAEFNLIYDRGTKFGLLSGGNVEAIFCSLPPLAAW